MSSQNPDEGTRSAFAILIPLIVLVIGSVVGFAVHKAKGPAAKPAVAAATPADAAQSQIVVEDGVVKFYFAVGQAALVPGAAEALVGAVQAAAEGKTLVLSGYHDATGDAQANAELAKRRALAVRDALTGAGVASERIELKKPEVLTGTGSDAEARRVEVSIQ